MSRHHDVTAESLRRSIREELDHADEVERSGNRYRAKCLRAAVEIKEVMLSWFTREDRTCPPPSSP